MLECDSMPLSVDEALYKTSLMFLIGPDMLVQGTGFIVIIYYCAVGNQSKTVHLIFTASKSPPIETVQLRIYTKLQTYYNIYSIVLFNIYNVKCILCSILLFPLSS